MCFVLPNFAHFVVTPRGSAVPRRPFFDNTLVWGREGLRGAFAQPGGKLVDIVRVFVVKSNIEIFGGVKNGFTK